MNEPQIALRFNVSESSVLTYGIERAIDGIRLEPNGSIIVPIRMDGGVVIGRPAACGTWERVD